MIIKKRSFFSGKVHQMDLPIKESQYIAWNNGMRIQDAFSNLTPMQREFLISGATEKEWNEHFSEIDSES